MEGDTSYIESTTTSHFEYERIVTVGPLTVEDAKSLRRRIRDLKTELLEIETDAESDEHAIYEISGLISELTVLVESDRTTLTEALNWPNALLRSSEKWIAIWESDIGKKMLNSRSAKTAENAILVAAITKQVEYTREMIAQFRERKSEHEKNGVAMCNQLKAEIAELDADIHVLRRECLDWEKRAAFNRARTTEMIEQHQGLERSVDEKEMLVAEIKNDINEFERELLALSYTLDQVVFH
uniref:Uncharacterized protein n=1 Tax=Panagrellus redivivus TaxID=6233 RepID=A0A7E4VTS5_PANRE